MTTVTFKVSMNEEERKAGNTKDVRLEVTFDGVDDGLVRRYAVQHRVIAWQAQIKNNWDDFIAGKMPTKVKFDEPLFAPKRTGVAPMTPERAEEYLLNADRLTQVRAAINLMEKAGMDVPDQLLEEEYNLSHPTNEA